jgi:hypothetical protein
MTKCLADPYFSTPLVFSPVFIDELSSTTKPSGSSGSGVLRSLELADGYIIILRSAVSLDLLIENMHTVVNSAITRSLTLDFMLGASLEMGQYCESTARKRAELKFGYVDRTI